ncbi:MAG: DUF2344 domain-containing protein [Polyangiaceae bacterium]|nr:DUF2344 domain-containing protein [Polyangiaceae bacterium]
MRGDRVAFLSKLGADKPRPSLPLADDGRAAPAAIRAITDRRVMRSVDQGPPLRVRLGFRKVGRIAFNSHLDLVRHFPRMFRRIELPLYFSEGFHPAPQMTFSPALSLGISSLGEYIDVKLRGRDLEDGRLDSLMADLNAVAFEGIEFFGMEKLGPNDPALSRVIDEAQYVAGIPRATLPSLGVADEAELRARIEARLAEDKLVVRRTVKGIGKNVDVKNTLATLVLGEGGDALAAAGIEGDLVPLRLGIRIAQAGTAKSSEVLQAIFERDEVFARLVRTGLFARRGEALHTPLELEAIRLARSEARSESRAEAESGVAS